MAETPLHNLAQRIHGDVQLDPISRALYATDASIYQVEPLGVVLPKDEADVAEVLRTARRHGLALLPRGGGTSLAGQSVGRALHLDFSKYMHRLLEVNAQERWAWVEPGIVLDQLNAQLASHDLKFAPDVSPSNRATIGGMVSNNSSGMYSLIYGKTIDHVLELKVMLADGSIAMLGPLTPDELTEKLKLDSLEGRAYRTVRRLGREHAQEIEQRFPKILRRVGGYNLDQFVPQEAQKIEDGGWRMEDGASMLHPPSSILHPPFNLANIIVGSEGTLAVILAAKLRLVPRPQQSAIGILAFDTLEQALDAVVPCLECGPAAVEMLDGILLDLTRRSPEYGRYLASFTQGTPQGLLQVEFFGDTPEAVRADLDRLERHLRAHHELDFVFTRALTATEKSAVLQVRKASMPLLLGLSPDLKPETFVEDSAVAPEKLSAYIRRFRAICHARGVKVAIYGHASVGLIHARPLLNLKSAEDVVKMRQIAEAVKDLVLEFGGALSGEHGDGLVRSEFNRELFGDTLYSAFREVKQTFDPHGLLNPGKIVDAPPMDANLRLGPNYRTIPFVSHFRFHDTGGFAGAAELCNGNGLCRKTSSGTMCPSYMVTRDEEHSTRGRANALRMVLSGALPPDELTSERMHAVLDLCIECKGCTGECPSRVNMTRLKSEWLSHYQAAHGTPLRARLFGAIHTLNRLGSALAPLSNWLPSLPGAALLTEKLLGISRHRRLPEFAREPFDVWFARTGSLRALNIMSALTPARAGHAPESVRSSGSSRSVILFPDTFTNYNEPQIGRAAVALLEAVGYEVLLPRKRVCCGRPLLSKGLLREAKALALEQLEWLAPYAQAGLPIIGLEPSCILTFRDEYPDLLNDPRAEALAAHTFLIDEFLARELQQGHATLPFGRNDQRPTTNDQRPTTNDQQATEASPRSSLVVGRSSFLLHGHCHQKALVGTTHALALLRMLPGATVREVDSGCCGMAGSFGYEAEHYAISQAIGERALLPAVRALPPEVEVVAMGTSCRHQIADATGRRARHLVEVLADALQHSIGMKDEG